ERLCVIGRDVVQGRIGEQKRSIVTNCLNCGAPLRLDPESGLLVCSHCGTQREAPTAIEQLEFLDETTCMCPLCSTPLLNSRLEGHAMLCCNNCFGMLIDMNNFVTIVDAMRAREQRAFRVVLPRRQNPGDRIVNCPKCRQPMLSHVYGGAGNLVIDTCEPC